VEAIGIILIKAFSYVFIFTFTSENNCRIQLRCVINGNLLNIGKHFFWKKFAKIYTQIQIIFLNINEFNILKNFMQY